MIEEYRDIEGYEGLYKISNLGNVVISKTEKAAHSKVFKTGYKYVYVSKKQNPKNFLIHRLVAAAFIPNPENKKTVNHKDGNKLNNSIKNLEWATHKENINHAIKTLKIKYGSGVKKGRLFKHVVQISLDGFILNTFDSRLNASIETGVSKSNISMCATGKYKTAGGFIWK